MGLNRSDSELKKMPMDNTAAALCVSHERPVACDVFLSSAGGPDAARESFLSHLHAKLAAAGVIVYSPGESQSSLLPDEALERSKICIPILSKDYPSSERCLRELVRMMEGKRSGRQMVLPIFDRVEPSDMRHLEGSFVKARRSDVEGAKRALYEASMLNGWLVADGCEEGKLVEIVVQTVRGCCVPHAAQYDVFLNFRGPDTRAGFTYRLRRAGVSDFKDDTDLITGEDFGSQLLSAISRPVDDAAAALCVSHERPVACVATYCDVFLSSAEGPDAARESFPGRLHASLAAAGVIVYSPGESQSSLLPDEALRWSKICIPILSEDYPSSERCLHELVQMMEGKRSERQMVLPIFYRVEPSHVRYLTGSFEKARRSDVEGVKTELFKVSMLSGWLVTDGCDEEKQVEIIVQTVRIYLQLDPQKCPRIDRYNVFLNFRGPDSRRGLASGLYTNLKRAGVSVFKDDISLIIGEDFGEQILGAISRSNIYITILSPGYASSRWCLIELKKMLDGAKRGEHRVLPIFLKVRPSEVRYQTGEYGNALHKQELRPDGMDAAREARQALKLVSEFRGWDFNDPRSLDTPDEQLIPKVVQETLEQLRHHFKLDVPPHLFRSRDVDDEIRD